MVADPRTAPEPSGDLRQIKVHGPAKTIRADSTGHRAVVETIDAVTASADTVPTSRATGQTAGIDIRILGQLKIRLGDTTLNASDLGGPKPRQVLEILLLNFGAAVSKTRIIDLLWNGSPPAVALPTLESYVSVLRRRLQPGAGRTGPLRTVTGGYLIEPSLVSLDLDRFGMLTKQASTAAPSVALALLTEALELGSAPLLGDELLPGWAEDERALHAEQVCRARVLAAEAAFLVGEVEMAIAWGTEVIRADPLNERAWTAMVLGLERNGETTEALRVFDRCRKVMSEQLGCTPSENLKKAQLRLLTSTGPVSSPTTPPIPPTPPTSAHVPSSRVSRAEVPPPTQETECLRVLIADDHTTFSELLACALDREPGFQSVGTATSVESAATMFQEVRPDVVVMDLYLADGSGLDAAEKILANLPEARIVMLTGNPSQEALREAARIGICGFLPKDGSLAVMLDTLRHVRPGSMIVHPSLVMRLGTATGFTPDLPRTSLGALPDVSFPQEPPPRTP